jgi:hypothetical protein
MKAQCRGGECQERRHLLHCPDSRVKGSESPITLHSKDPAGLNLTFRKLLKETSGRRVTLYSVAAVLMGAAFKETTNYVLSGPTVLVPGPALPSSEVNIGSFTPPAVWWEHSPWDICI